MTDNKWSLKIRGKIALGYFVILFLLGVFLLMVSGRVVDLEQETRYLSDHDMQVHELTYLIEKNLLDMETGMRGYALTGNLDYLAPYNDGIVKWRLNYAKLYNLIQDNPVQTQNLSNIKATIEKWISQGGQHAVDLKRTGQEEALSTYFKNGTGKAIFDLIRDQSEYFRSNEKALTMNRIDDLTQSNQKLFITMYVLWGLVALAATGASVLISKSIVGTLSLVTKAINNIAVGGNMRERIEVRTRDEIYDLGKATNLLLDTIEREQWSKDQINYMSIALQETADISSLCRIFMNKLASILEMQYGAVFVLTNEEELEHIYSYAGNGDRDKSDLSAPIKLGEGLVGQCALDKQIIVVEELPTDYISIKSGLGQTAPRYAVIAPVVFENGVVAVIEIASLNKWASYHYELLNQLMKMMAVSINSVMTRMEIQKLYGESQVMNEELQVQSEELQVQSEELQNHTNELIVLNSELESQKFVAENAAIELEKYNEQLEQSSRYKSEFLANMSHELRTPLNSMLILSQLLTENRNETLSDEEQDYAAIIHSSGTDLLGLINDILDLSKVEAGKMLVEMDAVNLTELPSMLYGYFDKTAQKKNLQFTVSIARNVPDLFYTDEMRLHQIMRNLLSNAFKFTEEGSVELAVTKLNSFSTANFISEMPLLAFAVKDSGIGISEEKSELIFEAFRQADGSTVRKFGGTGLGLSISLQLAKLLGGHITLESIPNEGSTFTLYLPCRENESELETSLLLPYMEAASAVEIQGMHMDSDLNTVTEAHYQQLKGRTVLLVDDDQRNIFALEKGLEPYDMNLLTAQSGYECLQILREHPHMDMVLLDIMMPNLDGYDTLCIIREELMLVELPIIAISAKTMKEEREKCLASGATDFMGKPVVIKEVVTRMCRWFDIHSE
ncbi:CHASE3 domain-containing protein [Paenibacillus wynnii]|uniref:CHASE3 domain-containing protein n=1 Tax=Paenibacillus wynnii TaxID=268407 RepID=UPI002793405F|nr:CHASE3 domain-containing protein [Paenibacillus wynnii]MDQ0195008.1 two-component system chemotaxis sensor kinase CheA [Paenibacillus wynnii]